MGEGDLKLPLAVWIESRGIKIAAMIGGYQPVHMAAELTGESPATPSPSVDRSVRRIEYALEENTKSGRHALLVDPEEMVGFGR